MSAVPSGELPQAPPDAETWLALPDELWRAVAPHLRRALAGLPEDAATVRARRLRSVPARRLVSGRVRRDVAAELAEGGPLWRGVRQRVQEDPRLAAALVDAFERPLPAPEDGDDGSRVAAVDRDELKQARARARRIQRERDDALRRIDGAIARAEVAEAARAELEAALAKAEQRIRELEEQLAAAAADTATTVAREQRRHSSRIASLEEELRELRRQLHEREQAERRRDEPRPPSPAPAPHTPPAAARFVPGRPSRLPPDVRAGTTEAADLLLGRGRRVLIDGYNVTRRHRPDLDLAEQRRWLVDQLAALVAARGVDAVVVFDGARGRPTGRRERGVLVAFTPEGQSADDDLVFQVEATDLDEPLVVVTDDRELRDRLRPYRIDLLSTDELLWVLR